MLTVSDKGFKNYVEGYVLFDKRTFDLANNITYMDSEELTKTLKSLPESDRPFIQVAGFKSRIPKKFRKKPGEQLNLFGESEESSKQNISGLLF